MSWDIVEKEQFALGSGTPFVYRTIFITEYVARDLAKKFKNKNELENILIKTARRPLEERAYANFWANPGSSFEGKNYSLEEHKSKIYKEENAQITNTPKWLSWSGKTQIQSIPVMLAGKTAIIVTGDANRNKVLTVPGGGTTTVKIELPNNWDSLMKDLGYKPLNNYNVKLQNPVITQQQTNNFNSAQNKPSLKTYPNSRPEKRPSAEKYRQIRRQKMRNNFLTTQQNVRPSSEKYREMHKQNNFQSRQRNRRPSAEKYRQIHQQS